MRRFFSQIFLMAMLMVSAIPAVQIVPVSAQKYPREETLYFYLTETRPNAYQFNPYLPMWVIYGGLCQNVVEYLFYYNYANGSIMPWLATGYDLSSDFGTVTIYLRKGVTWSDGVEFNATDVVFTYNMLLTSHTPPLGLESTIQTLIESVEMIDAYTVKFNIKQPNPRIFTYDNVFVTIHSQPAIVPYHIWKDVDPTDYTNPDAVFTGPYKLIEVSPDGSRYVLERRDDWWATKVFGIRPAPRFVIYQWYGTMDAIMLALASDQLDFSTIVSKGTFMEVRQKNPFVRAWHLEEPYSIYDPLPLFLPVNNMRYPWNIREARIALSYAIDRDALNLISQEGIAPPYPGLFNHYVPPIYRELMYAKGEEHGVLTYDPSETEQIFTSLGWRKGADGIWVTNNGTRVTFEMLLTIEWEYIRAYGEQMVDMFRAVGIDATVKGLPWTPYVDAWDRGYWDGAAMWGGPGVFEPFPTLDWLHSRWVVPIGELSYGNLMRWKNSTYDNIVDQLRDMAPGTPEYLDLVGKALDIIYQDMPFICTIADAYIAPFNTKYWTNWPSAENPYTYGWLPYAVGGKLTCEGVIPAKISTTVVYYTKDTSEFRPQGTFRGVDQVWYGPFKAGDAARLPLDDAEFWIRMGYAAYTPVTKAPTEILEAISALQTSTDAKIEELRAEVRTLSGQVTNITTIAIVEGIALVIALVAAVILRRKPT